MIAALMDNTCTDPQFMGVGADHRRGWGWRMAQVLAERERTPIGKRLGIFLVHMPNGLRFEKNPDGSWATDNGQFKQKPYEFDATVYAQEIPELDRLCDDGEFIGAFQTGHSVTGAAVWLYAGAGSHSEEMTRRYNLGNRASWKSRVVASHVRLARKLRDAGIPVVICVDTAGGREAGSQEDAIGRIVRAEGIGYAVEPYGLKSWNKALPSVTMENFPGGLPNIGSQAQPAILIPTTAPMGPERVAWAEKREREGWVPAIGFWPGSLDGPAASKRGAS